MHMSAYNVYLKTSRPEKFDAREKISTNFARKMLPLSIYLI